jgi:hypothetical protein
MDAQTVKKFLDLYGKYSSGLSFAATDTGGNVREMRARIRGRLIAALTEWT